MADIHEYCSKITWLPCILTRFSWAQSHNFFIMDNRKFTQLFNICFSFIFLNCRVLETLFTHHTRCTGCPINLIQRNNIDGTFCPTNHRIPLPQPWPYKLGHTSWWNTLYLIPFIEKRWIADVGYWIPDARSSTCFYFHIPRKKKRDNMEWILDTFQDFLIA